jgi:hypothetical protein
MEDVLEVYHLPYDPDYPVVCMDESSKQLIGEVHTPIPCKPGQPRRMDDEYVRNGVAEIFMEVEPLAGKRHVAITQYRTRKDWAQQIKQMLDERYPHAIQVRLVMDNLNTHNIASLYETFSPQEARRLAERLDIQHTPRHGSWLNMAEIELSVLKGQCLNCRLAGMVTLQAEGAAWEKDRNSSTKNIDWQFRTADARIKLTRLYHSYNCYMVLGLWRSLGCAKTEQSPRLKTDFHFRYSRPIRSTFRNVERRCHGATAPPLCRALPLLQSSKVLHSRATSFP